MTYSMSHLNESSRTQSVVTNSIPPVMPRITFGNSCSLFYCNTLQHIATHCNTLQHTATHCNTMPTAVTHCNTLQHTATHCNALQDCNILQHKIPREVRATCTTCRPQHTATHCNTLQHTATHCNTLQHTAAEDTKGSKSNVHYMPPIVQPTHCDAAISHGTHINESWHTHE